MTEGVKLQNLRDFTVQIRTPDQKQIAGTGIAVSMDGQIVTCAHVVKDVLGVHPRDADGSEVGVYFPQARGGENKERCASVAACFEQHDDDVVLLQLSDGPAPLAPEQIPRLGRAEGSDLHGFRSYGYRRLENYLAGHAHGKIMGLVEPPLGKEVQTEPVQLTSQQINRGMSGSAVLDIDRNLVVGLVAETWFPDQTGKDRDTAWATDSYVLTFDPLNLHLEETPYPKGAASEPRADEDQIILASLNPGDELSQAPPLLDEWVGREDLLASLGRDFADPERRVTGLIGFGGEGKSSLARKWIENITPLSSPHFRSTGNGDLPESGGTKMGGPRGGDSVFWWSFYDEQSAERFFESALEWISGGSIDSRQYPSASAKVHLIAGMLAAGRYTFVLDGFEVMQHQEGDDYGLIKSNELREFLEYFANPGHDSFCLVTSRAPLLDLMAYTTYTHRDVDRLTENEGCSLLRELGVDGRDEELIKVVNQWDGHALTVGLVGSYLAAVYAGDVTKADELVIVGEEGLAPMPAPDDAEIAPIAHKYEHVHRVLRRYDEHLTEAECAFLTLFSAFRTPVKPEAFEKVFRAQEKKPGFSEDSKEQEGVRKKPGFSLHASLSTLSDDEFTALVERLTAYRLLRYNPHEEHYTTHPLIRNHYLAHLTRDTGALDTHDHIKEYYLELAGDTPHYPTLEELQPLIEVVHHACCAGAYQEAHHIRREQIDQVNRQVMLHHLGAYETRLSLMTEFFPDGDWLKEPQGQDHEKSYTLNEVGLCLMNLGRLREAVPFYDRGNAMDAELEDWHNASISYRNLAELHIHVGALSEAAAAADQSLELARRAENKQDECNSWSWKGWIAHMRGELRMASDAFAQAESLEQEINPSIKYRFSLNGIQHADHLRRTNQADYSRRVTQANLEICERGRWPDKVSMCHRVLGDLNAVTGDHDSARSHYEQALQIARGITHRRVLIKALLARGRWAAKYTAETSERSEGVETLEVLGLPQAFNDLNEALGYAIQGGYRIYEADIRIGLAWAHHAAAEHDKAKAEAQRALQMSQEMGYYWGVVDAEEVLSVISGQWAVNGEQ